MWRIGLFIGSLVSICGAMAADTTTYTSATYRYTVQYPAGWFPDALTRTDTLIIDNFPVSKAVRAVHLPPGGAEIQLAPIESMRGARAPHNLNEWIELGMRSDPRAERHALEVNFPLGKKSVVEIKKNNCPVPPCLETQSWYFEYADHVFLAQLIFWTGDPHARELKHVFEQILLSLKTEK